MRFASFPDPREDLLMTRHLKLFLTSIVIYVAFALRGLHNNHYLDWTLDFQIGDCIEILVFAAPLIYVPLKRFSCKGEYVKDSIWFAMYLSVPFAVLDGIYLGWWKGYGPGYFRAFWFLTIYYFIVLVEAPVIGYLLQRDDPRVTRKHLVMLLLAVAAWLLNAWEGAATDHYLMWSLNMKLVRLTNVALLASSIVLIFDRATTDDRDRAAAGLFFALYFSFIFVVFDFFYLGVSKGHGLDYVFRYWHVTAFYPIFWIAMATAGRLVGAKTLPAPGGALESGLGE